MIRFLQGGSKAAKYILGGFLLILAASMVTYLIPGFMSGTDVNRSGVVAKVGGDEITTDEVQRMTTAQLRQQRYPDALAPFLRQQVMQYLIQQAELRYEARRLGFTVSDEELRDELQQGPYKELFFPEGKWIGQQKYEDLVSSQGGSVADFERMEKDNLLLRKLDEAITAAVSVTPAEIENAYKEKNTKVKFQYAVLSLQDISKSINSTEAELKAFYQTNLPRYQNSIPEKRRVRYFVLQDKDAESKIKVEASEVSQYYMANQDQYRLPERVRARHILIKVPADSKQDAKVVEAARAKAQDILKQLKAGGNFAELAKKYSDDPGSAAKGGELGWFTRGQMVAPFEQVAFARNPGQISDPVQTDFGFHIIQTEEKETARLKPLAEVKDSIENLLKQQKSGEVLQRAIDNAENTAKKGGIAKAAENAGVQLITSNPVSRNESLPGVGPSPDVMNAIFTATEKDGAQSARFPTGYVVFEIARIDPPKTPSFEEIKDRVTSDFKNQRGNELLQKKTQELADRAHAAHDLSKAAKEAGATVKTSDLVDRTAQVPDLGAMGGPLGAAFSLKPGEISGPLNLGQKGVVLALLDRQEPSLTDPQFAKDRDALQEQLSQQKKQQAMQLFMSNLSERLQKEGRLKINKNVAEQLTRARS